MDSKDKKRLQAWLNLYVPFRGWSVDEIETMVRNKDVLFDGESMSNIRFCSTKSGKRYLEVCDLPRLYIDKPRGGGG